VAEMVGIWHMRISYIIVIEVLKGSYFEDLRLYEGSGIMLKRILEKHDARKCTEVFWLDIRLRERESCGEQSNDIIFMFILCILINSYFLLLHQHIHK
jgi:hypothetical protein